jgi:hypothetical protein
LGDQHSQQQNHAKEIFPEHGPPLDPPFEFRNVRRCWRICVSIMFIIAQSAAPVPNNFNAKFT